MQSIADLAHDLKLTYIRDCAEDAIRQARHLKQDYAAFMESLLTLETERRAGNGVARRIKEAKFPIKKYLVDFNKGKYDPQFAPKFEELETLDFIENKENIILIGTPGAGKTHYAIAMCSQALVTLMPGFSFSSVAIIRGVLTK
jgi:DNA replication protein DnaC